MPQSRFAVAFALCALCLIPAASRAAQPPAPAAPVAPVAPAKPAAPAASAAPAADPWAGWRFLAGDWTGEDAKGVGTGAFSFRFELDDHVLVRRNHADLPAANGRPAAKHDDLMVIYPGVGKEAEYWDNEGHVLRYTADLSADGRTLTFVTAPVASAPRFRLTYTKTSDATLDIRFEIAPPGNPEGFTPYLSGRARRNGSPPAG